MLQSVHYNVHVRNRSKSRVLSDSLCNFDISRSENAIPVIKINFGLTDQKIQSMLRKRTVASRQIRGAQRSYMAHLMAHVARHRAVKVSSTSALPFGRSSTVNVENRKLMDDDAI